MNAEEAKAVFNSEVERFPEEVDPRVDRQKPLLWRKVTVHRNIVWFSGSSFARIVYFTGRLEGAAANLQLPPATKGSWVSALALPCLLFFPCNSPLSEAQLMAIVFSCKH